MTIPIALIGSGVFVEDAHKPGIEACSEIELKAVYSRTQATAEKLWGDNKNIEIYSDSSNGGLDALLARPDIKAVIIVLPIGKQPETVKKCLLAGKHVLSEKPVAPSLSQASELLAWKAANAPNLLWSVAENFRFQNAWSFAGSEAAKKLGKLITFKGELLSLIEGAGNRYFDTPWRQTPDFQGGFLFDGGIHFCAALRQMVEGYGAQGKIVKVAAFTSQNYEHLPDVDTVRAVLKTAGGAVGSLNISFGCPKLSFDFELVCEKGSVVVGWGNSVTVKETGKEDVVTVFEKDGGGVAGGVAGEIAAFAEAVKTGRQLEKSSPEQGVMDLEIIQRMLESGKSEGKSFDIKGGF